jgi:hypothetical protein
MLAHTLFTQKNRCYRGQKQAIPNAGLLSLVPTLFAHYRDSHFYGLARFSSRNGICLAGFA